MLDPKKDHIDYSELLKPPPGFVLKRAVGTTYSLDLQALLAVPVAMYYSKPLETDFEKNEAPLDVFDAISKAAKTVTIFCQKGKIKVPQKFNKLISFTEDCVKEITPPIAFSSFHPKCWWLWFHNSQTGDKTVRFAITSRNLTFDRSWDISFCFEGLVASETQPQNKSMVDMLNYLNNKSENVIEDVYKEQLSKTVFMSDIPFKSWNFHPIGINNKYLNPLSSNHYRPDTLLMMSPFIDDKSIMDVAGKVSEKCWLFSRKTELQKINIGSFEHINGSYCIPNTIVNGEFIDQMAEDVPNTEPGYLDLHAKLYISRKGNTHTWFLGSANLTEPAFGRNIECLIELKIDNYDYRPDVVYKELVSTADENKLFEEFIPLDKKGETEQDKLKPVLRKLIYAITSSKLSGELIFDDVRDYFTYKMFFDASGLHIPKDIKIYLQPWSIETSSDYGLLIKHGKVNVLPFDRQLKESQLSKYFIFTLTYKGKWQNSFMVKAEIDIPETRQGKILSEIINSKEKFLQYLRFLLSNSGIVDEAVFGHQNTESSSQTGHPEASWVKYSLPIYEEFLRAASQQPEKLHSIDELITKLKADEKSREFISLEFNELWDVFKQIIK